MFVGAHEQFGSISWAENVSKIIYVDPKSWICQRNPFYDGVKRCWCSDLTGMCLCGREGEAACPCDIRHGSNTSLDCEPALSLWKSRERLQQRLVLSEKSRCFPRGLQCEEPAWMGRLVRRRSRPEGPDHEEAGWLSETQRDAWLAGRTERAVIYRLTTWHKERLALLPSAAGTFGPSVVCLLRPDLWPLHWWLLCESRNSFQFVFSKLLCLMVDGDGF